MKLLFPLLLIPIQAFSFEVKKGDSITVVPGKYDRIIEHDYIRDDWALLKHTEYIRTDMAGKSYKIYKVRKGTAYFKAWDKKINEWSPLKFKFDISEAVKAGAVTIISQKQ